MSTSERLKSLRAIPDCAWAADEIEQLRGGVQRAHKYLNEGDEDTALKILDALMRRMSTAIG